MDKEELEAIQSDVQRALNKEFEEIALGTPAFSLSLSFTDTGQVLVKVTEAMTDHADQPEKSKVEFVLKKVKEKIGQDVAVALHPDTRPVILD